MARVMVQYIQSERGLTNGNIEQVWLAVFYGTDVVNGLDYTALTLVWDGSETNNNIDAKFGAAARAAANTILNSTGVLGVTVPVNGVYSPAYRRS